MSSIFKPKVPPPPPPPPEPEVYGFSSEVQGIERIPVKNADGTTTIVEKRLETDDQREQREYLEGLASSYLDRIDELTNNYDVDDIDGLRDTLSTFREQNVMGITRGYENRSNIEERSLARYGQSDSTAAENLRSSRGRDLQQEFRNLDVAEQQLEQDIRSNELNNTINAFGLVTGRQDVASGQIANAFNRGQQGSQFMTNALQQRNFKVYDGGLAQQQLQFGANQAMYQNIGAAAGLGAKAFGFGGFGAPA